MIILVPEITRMMTKNHPKFKMIILNLSYHPSGIFLGTGWPAVFFLPLGPWDSRMAIGWCRYARTGQDDSRMAIGWLYLVWASWGPKGDPKGPETSKPRYF